MTSRHPPDHQAASLSTTADSRDAEASRETATHPSRPPSAKGARAASGLRFALLLAVLGTATWWVHRPVLSAEAECMNDGRYVTANPLVLNPSWSAAGRFLTEVRRPSTVRGYYQPLSMISLMLDTALGGGPDRPGPYHRTSLLLHVANTLLVTVLIYQLLGRAWVAGVCGLLFGLHPMAVEVVAWLGERKTALSACFALSCLIVYVRHARRASWWSYIAALGLFALALLSKPIVTPLPAVMLLLDAWPLRRLSVRAVIEKIPFFVLAAVGAVVTVVSQRHSELVAFRELSGFDQVLLIAHNLVFYPAKMIWPRPLSVVYPFPDPITLSNTAVLIGLAGAVLLVLVTVVSLRWTRALFVSALIFLVLLAPTLMNMGYSMGVAADKYAYLPVVGLLLGVGWMLVRAEERIRGPASRRVAGVLVGVTVAAAGGLEASATRSYLARWSTTESLCEHILSVAPHTPWARMLLGNALLDDGRIEAAIDAYGQALADQPTNPNVHVNLGRALMQGERLDEALRHFARAIALDPSVPESQYNLAACLLRLGRFEPAARHFEESLRLRPDLREARAGLAHAQAGLADLLTGRGEHEQAIRHYRRAVENGMDSPDVRNRLAAALARSGNLPEAIAVLRTTVRLAPDYPEAQHNLALFLAARGQFDEAISHAQAALRVRPDSPETHYQLAMFLVQVHRESEAVEHFRRAAGLDPGVAVIHRHLGQTLLQLGRIEEAVDALERAVTLDPADTSAREALKQARARSKSANPNGTRPSTGTQPGTESAAE
jgi:tetratricopeptide (TPR) repeat protein